MATQPGVTGPAIVLKIDQRPMGPILSEVRDVIDSAAMTIQPRPQFEVKTGQAAHPIEGEAYLGAKILALSNASKLMHTLL